MSSSTLRRRQTEAEKHVNRLRNCMPEKFNTLCKMHLSFLLDLDGTKLEELFGETEKLHDAKKKSSTPFSKKKVTERFGCLFGSPLSQENVAQVYQLIEFLGRPENIKTEGLFRKTGNLCRQKLLKEWLNQGVELGLEDGTFSPHDCATVLKNYLGELPEPLLTEKHYEAHLQVVDMMSGADLEKEKVRAQNKQLKTIQLLLLLLPKENSLMLECLLDLLHRVTKVSENMMTAHSLGTVFAPHLLCPRKMPPVELQAISGLITQEVSFMIEHCPQIFKIPRELGADVANYWREMEQKEVLDVPTLDQENIVDINLYNSKVSDPKKWGSTQAVNTVITFADRKPSEEFDSHIDTQVALAELYAHVQAMPDSAKKKKLLKQFNRANGMSAGKGKHARSRTFGESIKKHFPILHKHKRRGSNDPTSCTAGLSWNITQPIDIDDNVTTLRVTRTDRTPEPYRKESGSPAVHIVDLQGSPNTPTYRKRRSSESGDEYVPEKREALRKLPSSENEILYIGKDPLVRKLCPGTPNRHRKHIVLSPITHSVKKAPKSVQRAVMTPRSRVPMLLLQGSPNISARESHL